MGAEIMIAPEVGAAYLSSNMHHAINSCTMGYSQLTWFDLVISLIFACIISYLITRNLDP